ncbi:NDP-sugar synthase [Candidatus Omnitrophota bacterium]
MSKDKQAIILAGGKGSRLEPYTASIPKPLMPVGELPILEIVIRQLRYYGFRRIKIAVGHLSGLIKAHFADGKRFDVKIEYSFEDKPLGTVGPLSIIEDLDQDFLILNGDLVTDLDFAELLRFHVKKKNLATIGIYKKDLKIDLGIIEFDEHRNVSDYIEKPTIQYPVSMGIYAFNKKISSYIPRSQKYDFPDLVKLLIKKKQRIGSYLFDGYWCDIGNLEDYRKVNEEFAGVRKGLLKIDD